MARVWKPPFLTSSPVHCRVPGVKVGSVEVVVVVVASSEVDEDEAVEVVVIVVEGDEVVEVVRIVGPGVMRQEHPDDTLDAGYCDTYVGRG